MPDQIIPSFEHEALEADLKVLAQEIRKQRETPESKSLGEKDLLKEAIKAMPVPAVPMPLPKSPQQAATSPLPAYAQTAPAEIKLEIEYLLDIAFHHGIAKAMTEAKKSPAFVLDAFHDSLAGKLYPELQKRGILK